MGNKSRESKVVDCPGLQLTADRSSDSRADAPIQGSKGISASADHVAVVDNDGVSVFKNGNRVKHVAGSNFTSVAIHGSHLAYGSADKKIRLTAIEGDASSTFDDSRGEVISLAFSPDGKYLAGGDVSLLSQP